MGPYILQKDLPFERWVLSYIGEILLHLQHQNHHPHCVLLLSNFYQTYSMVSIHNVLAHPCVHFTSQVPYTVVPFKQSMSLFLTRISMRELRIPDIVCSNLLGLLTIRLFCSGILVLVSYFGKYKFYMFKSELMRGV